MTTLGYIILGILVALFLAALLALVVQAIYNHQSVNGQLRQDLALAKQEVIHARQLAFVSAPALAAPVVAAPIPAAPAIAAPPVAAPVPAAPPATPTA